MNESDLGLVCPACGVSKQNFEPYLEKMSLVRVKKLAYHIHPIIVHYPQAFITFLFLLQLLYLFIQNTDVSLIQSTIILLSYSLPFVVIAAFLTGLYDGKIRFKRVTTPILKQKIVFGIIFFIMSIILVVIIPFWEVQPNLLYYMLLITGIGIICATKLGLKGSSILNSKLPN